MYKVITSQFYKTLKPISLVHQSKIDLDKFSFLKSVEVVLFKRKEFCVLENVFSECYMDKFRAWVDQYLEQEMNKKEHFAFGTNKTIFRVPEKLPSDLLYSYLQFDAGSDDHKTPAFNHVIDR